MQIKIGAEVRTGCDVTVPENVINQHLIITGMSGSGKTWRLFQLEKSIAKQCGRVLVLDYGGTHRDIPVSEEILQRISVRNTGVPISLLERMGASNEKECDLKDRIGAVMSILEGLGRIGVRQKAALRKAVIYALESCSAGENELQAIGSGLKCQKTVEASAVYEKFWSLWENGDFHKGKEKLCDGCINILDYTGFDALTQRILVEMTLSVIWRSFQNSFTDFQPLYLVCDEAQNLNLKEGSTLSEILREGRKYGLNLILSTQSMTTEMESGTVLQQAATHIFFRPASKEIKKISKYAYGDYANKGMQIFKNLKRGECVATGIFSLNGTLVEKAIKIAALEKV